MRILKLQILREQSYNIDLSQWRIQDFPEGGREPSRGGVNTPNFPRKLHEIERIWTPRGGVRPSRPP